LELGDCLFVCSEMHRVLETELSFARVEPWEVQMTLSDFFGRTGRSLAAGVGILGLVGITAMPRPAYAVDPGAAVGIGLGALAVGTALGAASNPAYNPYYNPYGYYGPPASAYTPAPAYYPPRAYYQPRSCWDPYYRYYYNC
jgi:hypothetical protein